MTRSFSVIPEFTRSFSKFRDSEAVLHRAKDFWDILTSYTTNYKEQNGGHRNGAFHCDIHANKC